MSPRTAGIIVIGDEILKGMTQDTNSFFICKKLYSLGVRVEKISVVPDDVIHIAAVVSEFSNTYDVVITSGGVGPTHDDVSYEGVARAFGESLELNDEMVKVVHMYHPGGNSVEENPALKMAKLPKSAVLIKFGENNHNECFPIARVGNVILFPGIPQILEYAFSRLKPCDLFPSVGNSKSLVSSQNFHCHRIYFMADEVELVGALDKTVAKFGNNVKIGSYPILNNLSYKTLVTVESLDELLAVKAKDFLRMEAAHGKEVPPPEVESSGHCKDNVDFSSVAKEVSQKVYHLLKDIDTPKSLHKPLQVAIEIVEECFSRYDPKSELFLSFNGGKDCTALLHLVFAVLTNRFPGIHLNALYIQAKDPFPELEDFVQKAALRYDLKLHVIKGPLKEALGEFKNIHSSIKAVLIGTRRTDPKSVSLEPFQMTDGDWPRMMRVSPLLDWSYENIWTFLRILSVPYCSLYDQGYTSIGNRANTFPNPALQYTAENGEKKFHPAYTLKDGAIERSGRQFGVLKSAAELTSGIVEVMATAFGPNGLAVLFPRASNASSSLPGVSTLISRTGIEILEILVCKNENNTVHPLLKPLLDVSRLLEREWGDGVKSLVVITSELLRQCVSLGFDQRAGWLRKELKKVLTRLDEICGPPGNISSSSSYANNTYCLVESHSPLQNSTSHSTESLKIPNLDSEISSFRSKNMHELMLYFFRTRFPSHVTDVIPNLLCEWIKTSMQKSRGFDFVVNNFNSLCSVRVGLPTDQSSILPGVLVGGYGVGGLFSSNSIQMHHESCEYSMQNHIRNSSACSNYSNSCYGCIPIIVEFITERELESIFGIEGSCNIKSKCLYLTSCVASDLVKFKIRQLNVSLVHSIPCDELNFLHYLLKENASSYGHIHGYEVRWAKVGCRQMKIDPACIWLEVPGVQSLNLCVPVEGMKVGVKRSCHNALNLMRKSHLLCRGSVTESQITSNLLETKAQILDCEIHTFCNSSLNSKGDKNSSEKDLALLKSINLLPIGVTSKSEKLMPNSALLLDLGGHLRAGGLAEILIHDMIVDWWLVPSINITETIDRDVTKAISQACLAVPRLLSRNGKVLCRQLQPITCNFSDQSEEMVFHRIRILYNAVSVVFSLSNISEVLIITKKASKLKVNYSAKDIDTDDSE